MGMVGRLRIGVREGRQACRSYASLPVLVEAEDQAVLGIATNLGLGGMFVRSLESPTYATRAVIRITAPDHDELCLTGTRVRAFLYDQGEGER